MCKYVSVQNLTIMLLIILLAIISQLNFVRAPHHVKPIDGLDSDKMRKKLDRLSNTKDPFAKKKMLGSGK